MAPRTIAAVLLALSAAATASECASKVEGACSAPGEEVDTVSALQSRRFATVMENQDECSDCFFSTRECENSGIGKCEDAADCGSPWPTVLNAMECQHSQGADDQCTCVPLPPIDNNAPCTGGAQQTCWGSVQGTNCDGGSGEGCKQKPALAGDFCWFSGASNNFRYCPGATDEDSTTSMEATTTSMEDTTTSDEGTTTSMEATTTSMEATSTSQEDTTTSMEATTSSMEDTTTSDEGTTTSMEATTTSMEATSTSQEDSTTSMEATSTSQEDTTTSMEATTTSMEATTTSAEATTTRMAQKKQVAQKKSYRWGQASKPWFPPKQEGGGSQIVTVEARMRQPEGSHYIYPHTYTHPHTGAQKYS